MTSQQVLAVSQRIHQEASALYAEGFAVFFPTAVDQVGINRSGLLLAWAAES